MDWSTFFTAFPAFDWQRLMMAVGLVIIFLTMLMAVKSRSRRAKRPVV